jgi:hypothetical protein
MNSRHVLGYLYAGGASIIALLVVKVAVIMGGLAYAPVLYPVSIGASLVTADALGVKLHSAKLYTGVIRLRILGAIFLILGVLVWLSGAWKQ